jgi:hypothetical protein
MYLFVRAKQHREESGRQLRLLAVNAGVLNWLEEHAPCAPIVIECPPHKEPRL